MGFNLIYWTSMGGFYISGWIWPDWGNTARADLAGLGSIGLKSQENSPFHRDMW